MWDWVFGIWYIGFGVSGSGWGLGFRVEGGG